MNLIDTHCHLDNDAFDHDREEVIDNSRQLGINKIIIPGVSRNSWDKLLSLCDNSKHLYPALGLHPYFTSTHKDADLIDLQSYLDSNTAIAIGEIGLDYYLKDIDKEKQIYFFEQQLLIAQKNNLPVILHVRKAHADVIALLKKIKVKGGICHAYNGSYEQAQEYLKLNFIFGFGGTITYPQSTKLRNLASRLPLESIVLETDAPDMAVANHHGERNSPEYIIDCARALAQIREQDIDVIAQQTSANACILLDIQ